jgi:MoaA/NifB/PqqE/SkfB family radical SAM enzyme
MFDLLRRELHYAARSLSLGRNFLGRRPFHVNLQVTYRCNFTCEICDFWKTNHRPEDEFALSDIRQVGRTLKRFGTMIISLAGGEPLARTDLADIIRLLNDEGHFPILITNGWFVDEARAQEILQAGLQEISVSIDYADPARHDRQRGVDGAWDRGIKALERLRRHRPDPRNRIHMISVLMEDNLDEIEPMIKIAKDLGVTYMVNLYSWNRGSKHSRLPDSRGVTRHLLDLKRRYPEFITLTSYIERLDEAVANGGIGNCQAGRLLFNIDPRGRVARCTEMLDQPVGNILTDDMRTIRRRLAEKQERDTCAQCWTSCRGFAESMYASPRWRQWKEFFISVKPN